MEWLDLVHGRRRGRAVAQEEEAADAQNEYAETYEHRNTKPRVHAIAIGIGGPRL
jgi:hypothetical protein